MRLLTVGCVVVGLTLGAARNVHANTWDEFRCTIVYGASATTYLTALYTAKKAGLLRDRLHAHGLLNGFLAAAEEAKKNTAFVAALSQSGDVGAAATVTLWVAKHDPKCLKAGIDIVFPEPPKPSGRKIDKEPR
jgi:hypothetical protein